MKKFYKKALWMSLLPCLATFTLHSDDQMDRIAKQTGSSVETTSVGDDADVKARQAEIYNYQEVVYERILQNQVIDTKITDSKTDETFAFSNVKAEQARLKELSSKIQNEIKTKQAEIAKQDIFVSGYCYVDNEITIERLPSYAYLECDFEKSLGHAVLAISVTPDFYAKALIGSPIYIEKDGQRLPVVSGAILTKDRNSINIANLINDRKVTKLLTTGLYTATTVVAETAKSYLTMKEEAAKTTDTNIIASPSGTTTVSNENTKEIPLENYIFLGAMQLASSFTKVLGEAIVRDLPYTFKIYKDSVLYADLQLSKDNKVIGFKTVNKDGALQAVEPTFTLGGEQQKEEPLKINQREDKK